MKQASMERKILSYSISLALCLLMFLPLRAQNGNPTVPPQGAPPKKEKKDAKKKCTIRYTTACPSAWTCGESEVPYLEEIS